MPPEIYDRIGDRYSRTRAADSRIVDGLVEALRVSPPAKLLDVGGGTGNYAMALAERGFPITVVEPSAIMREQARPDPSIAWVAARAEELPLENASHAGAIIVLAAHHFTDVGKALAEVGRVCGDGPVVLFTFDPERAPGFWLFHYFPSFLTQVREVFPALATLQKLSPRPMAVRRFPLPRDLEDGFAAAGWCRPEAYLDEVFRNGISSFRLGNQEEVAAGLEALRRDLASGEWDRRFGGFRKEPEYDAGYVFVTFR
jgi:ubiquinone/menaquinone biosynthesis C-methylase UbiE